MLRQCGSGLGLASVQPRIKACLKVLLKVLRRLLKARLKVLLKVLVRLLKARLEVLLKVLISYKAPKSLSEGPS